MITKQEFEFIKARVFETLNFSYDGEIELAEADGAYVKTDKNKCIIGASEKILCARSLMLMAQHIDEVGFEALQKPQFDTNGVMFDLSRGAVMRVDAIKKYLNYMACFGVNTLWMYMEDVFELEGYPMFGYMRGRYTANELKEVDDYAEKLGIEVVPCIQTLAHLGTYLRWDEAKDFRTSLGTLLCDEEKTFEFIEALIRTMKGIFRTDRIHIGMDEAHDFCDGKYKELHGEADKFEVILRHLTRVTDICEKYELKPMIWDDMFFKLGSKTGEYYDIDSVISEDVKAKIPDVDLVYWDYDRNSVERYEKLMKAHMDMGKKVIFAGSFWVHVTGHLPVTRNLFVTLEKGLIAAKNMGIKETVACLWGDCGTECNFFLSLPYLAILAEHCYNADCTRECIEKSAEFVTKIDFNAMYAMSEYHLPLMDDGVEEFYIGIGKRLFYTDLIYNLTREVEIFNTLVNNYENAYNIMKNLAEKGGVWEKAYSYSADIFNILKMKADIIINIRKEYAANNKEYFKHLADVVLPEMTELYKRIYKQAERMWMYTNKVFGWETLSARYGRMILRTEYYTEAVRKFACGESDKIEELDFEYIEIKTKPREWGVLYDDSKNVTITG